MKKSYIIKLFRSKKKYFKMNMYYICVGLKKKHTIVLEKIGSIFFFEKKKVCFLNTYRLGYWMNKGCEMKPKISWLLGTLYSQPQPEQNVEFFRKKEKKKKKNCY